ncbi:MAG TPA: family 43 glycosylhydrolase [Opitutaceae bacterium]|nr:family 43 glycosylhydrolase [Opitutaceae bacterium]
MGAPHTRLLTTIVFLTALASAAQIFADYPVASHRYLADPATLVHEGRVYVYCSNDDENPVGGDYSMKSIVCISSSDMKNWTDHGVVFRVPSGAAWAGNSWAPAVAARNGQFYLYFGNGASNIGVASSDSPIGPFTDARGSSLINSATPGVLPATNMWIFDPAVFIDDDGQAYLYFGGNGESNVRIIRLNEDMISVSGSAIALTVQYFFEAAWMHKRDGLYYFSYSTNTPNGLRIDYLTSDSPTGPFTYRGIVAGQPPSNNNNNHAAIFELNGAWYHVYHNRIVSTQAGIPTVYRRNIAIERFDYNPDGTIQQVAYTTDGVPQAGFLDPYTRVEAETFNAQSGIETETVAGGMSVMDIHDGDWIRVRGVDFGSIGASQFSARVASAAGGGSIELRLDTLAGPLVGTCPVPATGGAQSWTTATCDVAGATGVHDLYLKFIGAAAFSFDWWEFIPPPVPQITTQPRSLTIEPGKRVTLWVEAGSAQPLRYQWFKDAAPITGAISRSLEIEAAEASDAGSYTVAVTNDTGTTTSSAAIVAINASVSSRIVNLSARAPLTTGALLIPGFVLIGTEPGPLLIRTIGPTLANYNVTNAHPDPAMTLFAGQNSMLANDDWGDAANAAAIADATIARGAFALGAASRDAAAFVDLAPGLYTTHISGAPGSSGLVLFELYEDGRSDLQLVNVSARADNGTGENIMILGFVIAGTGARTLLIRAVGPSLADHNVTGWLEDPVLTIYQGDTPILTVDDWGDAPDIAALTATMNTAGAFPLIDGSTDAAVVVSLMPGLYTALARGVGDTTGNVLVEVYDLH